MVVRFIRSQILSTTKMEYQAINPEPVRVSVYQ